mgnify:CR=1 FL=1
MLNLDKSHWKRVAFGDVVRNVNETVRDLETAGIDRVIAMEHMDPGELKISRWGSTMDGTTFTRRVKPGQTLFGKRRAYQRKVAYAEFDAICSGDIYTFETDETRLLGELLPFLVQSNGFFEHALGTSAGSLSPRTNWRDLKDFEFDLPSLEEQKRIADLLWAAERHGRALGKVHAEVIHSQSELVEQFVRSAPGREVILGDVLRIVRGGSPRPINEYLTDSPDGLHWIKIGDVPPDGKFIDKTAQRIKPSGLSKTRTVKPGDFILSNSMSFGRPYIVRIDGCIHDGWLSLSDVGGCWRTDYLYYLLRSHGVQSQFRQGAGGSTVKNLNTDIVSRVTVVLPSLEDQDSLLEQMASASSAVAAVAEEADAVKATKSTLSETVFGGNR